MNPILAQPVIVPIFARRGTVLSVFAPSFEHFPACLALYFDRLTRFHKSVIPPRTAFTVLNPLIFAIPRMCCAIIPEATTLGTPHPRMPFPNTMNKFYTATTA